MKKTLRKTKNRPVEVIVEKGQQIPIYKSPVTSKGKTYESFLVAYFQAGRRVRRRAASIDEAREIAVTSAQQLAEGTGHVQTLTPSQIADFNAAEKIIRQHPGRSLAAVVAEWAEATRALGEGSIVAACEAQAKATKKRSGFTGALVSKVYEEFLASLELDEASKRYIEDCRSRMGQIKDQFRGYIHAVEVADLEAWLESKKISIRTRKNYRTAAVTLWSFAKSKGYLPRDQQTEAELLTNRKRTKAARLRAEIGTYEPADLRKILEAAPKHLLPAFAVGAFSGLRQSELHRLTWGNIRPSFIQVDAIDSKNPVRRHAPVLVALKEWLADCTRGEDDERICARFSRETGLARAMTKAVKEAGVQPVHNGLRHTWCSARVAVTDDVNQTSREAGNSPGIILKDYVKVMTRAKGQAWFNVRPSASTSSKVLSFAA
jgi:integrase